MRQVKDKGHGLSATESLVSMSDYHVLPGKRCSLDFPTNWLRMLMCESVKKKKKKKSKERKRYMNHGFCNVVV